MRRYRFYLWPMMVLLGIQLACGCLRQNQFKTLHLPDPKLSPFLSALPKDREQLGFPPIPERGKVRIEKVFCSDGTKGHNQITLTFKKYYSWYIQFSQRGESYEYIYEQHFFMGPHRFQGEDSEEQERVEMYYLKHPTFQKGPSLLIVYFGDRPEYGKKFNCTLEDVRPLLIEWGYLEN